MPFAMCKASFDSNYWIWTKDLNSFITSSLWDLIVSVPDHCLSFYFVFCRVRRLTKWQYKHFNAAIYIRPIIQNQKLYTFYRLWVYVVVFFVSQFTNIRNPLQTIQYINDSWYSLPDLYKWKKMMTKIKFLTVFQKSWVI